MDHFLSLLTLAPLRVGLTVYFTGHDASEALMTSAIGSYRVEELHPGESVSEPPAGSVSGTGKLPPPYKMPEIEPT